MEDRDKILSFSELIGTKAEKQIKESNSQNEDVLSFVEFLSQDTNIGKEITEIVINAKEELDEINPNLDQSRTDKIIEALKKTKFTNRVNLLDPEYLKDSYEKYLKAIEKENFERQKRIKFASQNVSGGLKRTISQVIIAYCRIGTAIIGQCKIG